MRYNGGMSHQLPAALMAACLLIIPTTLTACDDDASAGGWTPEPAMSGCTAANSPPIPLMPPSGLDGESDDLEFREAGPPALLWLSQWQGKTIDRAVAKQIIDACAKQLNPPQTCTLSWYQPDTTKPDFVLGLGCSMMATMPLLKCYRDKFLANGALAG